MSEPAGRERVPQPVEADIELTQRCARATEDFVDAEADKVAMG